MLRLSSPNSLDQDTEENLSSKQNNTGMYQEQSSVLKAQDTLDDSTLSIKSADGLQDGDAYSTSERPPNFPPLQFVRDWLQKFLGMEPTVDILAIVTIYFVEGAVGLAALAKTYLLKDELALGPAELSALMGFFVLPWTIKPLYGFLSDGFPLFGYRRKSYLVGAGVLGALSYGLLGSSSFWDGLSPNSAMAGTVVALLLSSACIALSDVVADGIVVTKTRESADNPAVAGGLQSLCWGASATGSLLSAYFSGSLLKVLSVRDIFAVTAVLPLLVALIAFQMNEEPVIAATSQEGRSENTVMDTIRDQMAQLWEAFKQPSIWRPALFLFLWQATPTADGAFFFFLTNELGMGPEFMGRVRLVTSLATLVGVALYNNFFKTVPIKQILKWSAVASFPLGMVPILLTTHVNRAWGIPDQALIYGDDVVLAMLGEIAFLPCLVLAARLCPPGVEAVLFATLMSIFNGASTVGTEIGAGLTKIFGITENNFDNLTWLIVFCNVTSLYPLLFLGFLDKIGDQSEIELEREQKDQSFPQSGDDSSSPTR
ncbi:hypothetical protein ACA910_002555 [Epithemia clementina (nom. ined.)]